MLGGGLWVLTACGESAVSVDAIALRPPEPEVTAPCAAGRALGTGPMTQAEVEQAWIADRSALRDCRARHALAVQWIEAVSDALSR